MIKYLFIIPFLLFPFFAHGAITGSPKLNVASSTHSIGFTIYDFTVTGVNPTDEIRMYPINYTGSLTSANSCYVYQLWRSMAGSGSISLTIKPDTFLLSNSGTPYRCLANGYYYIYFFPSSTSTSPTYSLTIYLENYPLDIRSTFMLMFLIGGLLAILRPLILKLTLK